MIVALEETVSPSMIGMAVGINYVADRDAKLALGKIPDLQRLLWEQPVCRLHIPIRPRLPSRQSPGRRLSLWKE